MSWQRIELNMIPDTKVLPVVHASQFDSNRSISFQMFTGEDEWTIPEGLTIELHCRKVDDNIVTLAPLSVDGSVITFITTEQLTACSGQNKCELSFIDADDLVIGSLNFILDVEPDPLKGGLTSASSIYNLTQQIEDIAQEVIGDDYYNKTEVDTLLADKADKSDTYTKAQVDSALALKANTADLATVATSGDYDDLLNKPVLPDMSQYYTKSEVDAIVDDIFPAFTASGDIASFTTALNKPLVSVTADALATTITRCGINFWDEEIEFGLLNSDGSVDTTYTTRMVTKNFIPVVGGKTYAFVYNTSFGRGRAAWYDANKNLIQYYGDFPTTQIIDNRYALETAPANACYFKYCFTTSYGTTYLNDTSLNYPADNIYYEATKGVISVSKDIATSIETVSGINNVFADTGSVIVQYKYMSM